MCRTMSRAIQTRDRFAECRRNHETRPSYEILRIADADRGPAAKPRSCEKSVLTSATDAEAGSDTCDLLKRPGKRPHKEGRERELLPPCPTEPAAAEAVLLPMLESMVSLTSDFLPRDRPMDRVWRRFWLPPASVAERVAFSSSVNIGLGVLSDISQPACAKIPGNIHVAVRSGHAMRERALQAGSEDKVSAEQLHVAGLRIGMSKRPFLIATRIPLVMLMLA